MLAAILVTVHTTLLDFYPGATLLSNLIILSMLLLATVLCLVGAFTECKETKSLWILVGAGFLLATVGQLGWTYSAFAAHLHIRVQAFNFDLDNHRRGLGLNWRGTWNGATAYAVSDAIEYDGSSYIAIVAGTNHEPDMSASSWNLLSQAGH